MQIQFKSNSIPSPFCLKVCAAYKAPTVTVAGAMDSSLAFSLECCISTINQGTSAQPQVNPLILAYLQKMACALANAVAWYASKQLTGQAPIINDNKYACFGFGIVPPQLPNTIFVAPGRLDYNLKENYVLQFACIASCLP
jgi:hypothetical protein